jgi:hypothetical protein
VAGGRRAAAEGLGQTGFIFPIRRRWPDDLDHANPFWFKLWKGPERVVYGHDAVRGLQVHPVSVGLDSGCVYGNPLSGFLLEEERVFQVPGSVK